MILGHTDLDSQDSSWIIIRMNHRRKSYILRILEGAALCACLVYNAQTCWRTFRSQKHDLIVRCLPVCISFSSLSFLSLHASFRAIQYLHSILFLLFFQSSIGYDSVHVCAIVSVYSQPFYCSLILTDTMLTLLFCEPWASLTPFSLWTLFPLSSWKQHVISVHGTLFLARTYQMYFLNHLCLLSFSLTQYLSLPILLS